MAQQRWPLFAATIVLTLCSFADLQNVTAQTPQEYNLCSYYGNNQILDIFPWSQPFIIKSPNYGVGFYSPNQHCSLALRVFYDTVIISFNIQSFAVEDQYFCGYDYFCLNGVRQCGVWHSSNHTLQYIVPTNKTFTLFFKTDYTTQLPGFQILVSVRYAGSETIQEAVSRVDGNNVNPVYVPARYYPGYHYTDRCPTPPDNSQVNNETEAPVANQSASDVLTMCYGSSNFVNVNSFSSFVIHSLHFIEKSFYPENSECEITLQSGNEPLILSFTFSYFRVEKHAECYFDSLCVNGINFCGSGNSNQSYPVILPENRRLTIRFKTDNSVNDRGFEIKVTAETAYNKPVAPGSIDFDQFTFYYPSSTYYPGMPYTDLCLLQQTNTTTSYPQYYNLTTESITDTTRPTTITTRPNTTNTWPTSTGNKYTLCDSRWSGVVDVQSSSPTFTIETPNFGNGGNYNNYQQCTAVIRSGPEPLILALSYIHFSLESQMPYCSFDSICVFGVKFCGIWPMSRTFHYILPPYRSFTLYFQTDNSVTSTGVQIHITPEYARNQAIQQVEGGVGFNDSGIYYSSVTYYDGYPYNDRCVSNTSFSSSNATTAINAATTTTTATTTQAQDVYDICQSSVVNVNALGAPFIIRSPRYWSGTYYDNQYCTLTLRASWQPLILTLNYRNFDLEQCSGCVCDYFCVYGVRFCNNWLGGYTFQYVLPAYRESTFVFRTDSSVVRTGFEIEVLQEQAYNQSIREAIAGVGDNNSSVLYRYVNFPFNETYVDRCLATTTTPNYPDTTPHYPETTTDTSCQTNVNEIEAAIYEAMNSLYRAQNLLQQLNRN